MTGVQTCALPISDDIILIARNMGPAELLDYDRSKLKGLVLEEGSATTHVAIVAKAFDIPVVGRATDVLDVVENLDPVIVDGDNADVHIRPTDEVRQVYAAALTARAERVAAYAGLRNQPAVSLDGVRLADSSRAVMLCAPSARLAMTSTE